MTEQIKAQSAYFPQQSAKQLKRILAQYPHMEQFVIGDIDSAGRKQGLFRIYQRYNETSAYLAHHRPYHNDILHGVVRGYYRNSNPRYQVTYEYGIPKGISQWWYANGHPLSMAYHKDNAMQGMVLNWSRHGNFNVMALEPQQESAQQEEKILYTGKEPIQMALVTAHDFDQNRHDIITKTKDIVTELVMQNPSLAESAKAMGYPIHNMDAVMP